MKGVMLDFDGVLNGIDTHEPMSAHVDGLFLNAELVTRLNRIIEQTGAKIVLSTSWRYHAGRAKCEAALRAVGFVGEIIGETPNFSSKGMYADTRTYTPRSDEIRAWLAANPVDAFVVLDDHGDADVDGCTVRTDTRVGLSDENVDTAIRILGGVA